MAVTVVQQTKSAILELIEYSFSISGLEQIVNEPCIYSSGYSYMSPFPEVLTLSSSVFPKLLMIFVYVMNFNRFIFCELVFSSTLIHASSWKIIILRKKMSGMRVLPLDFPRRFCHFSHMLAVLTCCYWRHCIETVGCWYLCISHKCKIDN